MVSVNLNLRGLFHRTDRGTKAPNHGSWCCRGPCQDDQNPSSRMGEISTFPSPGGPRPTNQGDARIRTFCRQYEHSHQNANFKCSQNKLFNEYLEYNLS